MPFTIKKRKIPSPPWNGKKNPTGLKSPDTYRKKRGKGFLSWVDQRILGARKRTFFYFVSQKIPLKSPPNKWKGKTKKGKPYHSLEDLNFPPLKPIPKSWEKNPSPFLPPNQQQPGEGKGREKKRRRFPHSLNKKKK